MTRTEPRGATVVIATGDGVTVADRCLVANTPRLRLVGLLGRRGLAEGEGLLLRGSGSIHMFFMRFAIDAVFLDDEDVVVKVAPDLRPWRLAAAKGAKAVLELPAGVCSRAGISVGARLDITLGAPENRA